MTDQLYFQRTARLIIGPKGAEQLDIRNLRMQFDITKTSETSPNQGTIKVWNLSPKTRSSLKEQETPFGVIFFSGYGQEEEITLIGDVIENGITSGKQGVDYITKIEVGDGQNAIEGSTTNISYGPGVTATAVVSQLISDLGIPLKTPLATTGLRPDISNTGEVLSGSTSDLLTQYLKRQDLEWNVQDEKLQIKAIGSPANSIEIVRITTDTGLVGTPMVKKDAIEFKALHNPKLIPGRVVSLKSRDVDGNFVIRKVIHRGDTDEGEFTSLVEVIR